ncbi:protease inhibitor I42 family protein [Chloroflexota bacterium]
MKRLLTLGLTSILAVSLIAACSGEVKTHTDADKTINTTVNQEFIIALDSNPTTGYNWEASYDESILKLADSKYEVGRQTQTDLVGAGGTQYFQFKALKTGKTEITVTYKRSWETDFAEQKVFNVDIK